MTGGICVADTVRVHVGALMAVVLVQLGACGGGSHDLSREADGVAAAPEAQSPRERPLAVASPGSAAPYFDTQYPGTFALKPWSADAIGWVNEPALKAASLSSPSYIDPSYRTRVFRATAPSDFPGASFVRHDYSRRQAFNAGNTRYLSQTSNGYWLLNDANSFKVLPRGGRQGALRGLAGDAEPIWHPSDPQALFYTSTNGGLVWFKKNVESDTDVVMADFTGRLPWPKATAVWTKSEGTSSADGRYWAFMATSYDAALQRNIIHGLLTYDRATDQVLSTYAASNFGGAFPDHISITPSGKFVVASWAYNKTLGTRAFPRDFSSSRQLHAQSEHSDLAIGPNGEDFLVLTDYDTGFLRAVNVATGVSINLMSLYPAAGEGYAAHVSGKAYGRSGWVVVSTYADFANYGGTVPSGSLRAMYRKILLVELKPSGRKLNVAHTRVAANAGGYFGEPQATVSRDGSRVMFASNFHDGGVPSSYVVGLPSWVYQ